MSPVTMINCSKKNASTNRPIVCPNCHPEYADVEHIDELVAQSRNLKTERDAIWSYNMSHHFETEHQGTEMIINLKKEIEHI